MLPIHPIRQPLLPERLLLIRHAQSALWVGRQELAGGDEYCFGVEDETEAGFVRDVDAAAVRDGLVEEEVAEDGGDGEAVGRVGNVYKGNRGISESSRVTGRARRDCYSHSQNGE